MSQVENTHWKNLKNNKYLGGYSLMTNGQKNNLIVRIAYAIQEDVIDITQPNAPKKPCLVVYLVNQKPFVCNSVNAKAITEALGSPYVGDWEGKLIELECKRIKAFGSWHEALRVKNTPPAEPSKPDLNVNHKNWEACLKGLKDGKTTLDNLKSKYTINDEHLELLSNAK